MRIASTAFADLLPVNLLTQSALTLADLEALYSQNNHADNRTTQFAYDSVNRLVFTFDGAGAIRENQYDASSNLIHTIAYAATTADLAANTDLQDVAAVQAQVALHLDAQQDQHTYLIVDKHNQVIAAINAQGYISTNRYDSLGQVIVEQQYAQALTNAQIEALRALDDLTAIEAQLASIINAANADSLIRSKTYSYDAQGGLTQFSNFEGTITAYAYNNADQITQTTSAQGLAQQRITQTSYRLDGLQESSTNARSLSTQYQYDAQGRLISTEDAKQQRSLFFYAADTGDLIYTVNAQGEVLKLGYDSFGQVISKANFATRLDSAALASLVGGNLDASVIAQLEALNNSATTAIEYYAYNTLGLIREAGSNADALAVYTDYNAFGELAQRRIDVSSTEQYVQDYAYDARGLELTQTQSYVVNQQLKSSLIIQQTTYDAFGREINIMNANGASSQMAYDRLGQIIQITDLNNSQTSYSFDAFNRKISETDGRGIQTRFAYSDADKSFTTEFADGSSTISKTNVHGEQVEFVDANGVSTFYAYDNNGNLLSVTDANGDSTVYTYDAVDQRLSETDRNQALTAFQYDALGRQTQQIEYVSGQALVTSYSYDARGNTLSKTDPNGLMVEYQYNLRNQQILIKHHAQLTRASYTSPCIFVFRIRFIP